MKNTNDNRLILEHRDTIEINDIKNYENCNNNESTTKIHIKSQNFNDYNKKKI